MAVKKKKAKNKLLAVQKQRKQQAEQQFQHQFCEWYLEMQGMTEEYNNLEACIVSQSVILSNSRQNTPTSKRSESGG